MVNYHIYRFKEYSPQNVVNMFCEGIYMTLIDGEKDSVYCVKEVNIEKPVFSMSLKSIGVNTGKKIKVVNKKKQGGLIIQVDKKQIAICRNVASGIIVEFVEKEYPEVM